MRTTRFRCRIAALALATIIIFTSNACAEFYSVGVNPNVRINVEDGEIQDIDIINSKSGEIFSSGFEIGFMDGGDIASFDLMVSHVEEAAGIVKLVMTSEIAGVSLTYKSDDNLNLIRKTLNICNKSKEAFTVDAVIVEEVDSDTRVYHGGRGQPVFNKSFFLGLESPIGYNLAEPYGVILMHYPGKTLYSGECFESFTAVIGADNGEGVEEAFRAYVDSIRYSFKSNLHYNSWFDIRSNNMSTENFADIFKAFKENLSKYDVSLDYFVVDDGWQNKDSIWESTEKTFPNGFGPLRDILESGGTRFGLWMPLSGYLLNPSWGEKNGYEVNDDARYYCMAGPKFNKQLRARIRELVEKEGVRYFKHDFNYFECYWPGQPYPRTKRHSFEANVNAEAALLDYIHEVNPDVFLNVTSNMWLSPWWLMHADTIWMHAGDYGYNYAGATLEPREWAMTYVDAFLYQRLVIEGARFPMNAIMTHGIIDGVLNRLGGENESFRTWADNVILYFGRGVYMRELYISPQLLNDKQWAFLAAAAKWAKSMDSVFRRTEWVGGDPNKGKAYGYHHFGGGENWYVLRNPDIKPQTIEIPLKENEIINQVYPIWSFTDEHRIELQSHELIVIRIKVKKDEFGLDAPQLAFSNNNYSIGNTTYGFTNSSAKYYGADRLIKGGLELITDDCVTKDEAYECTVQYIFRNKFTNMKFYVTMYSNVSSLVETIEINGKEVTSNIGMGWRLFNFDLSNENEMGVGIIRVRIPYNSILSTPFTDRKIKLRYYLEADQLPDNDIYDLGDGKYLSVNIETGISQHVKMNFKERVFPPMRDIETRRITLLTEEEELDFDKPEFPSPMPIQEQDLINIRAAKIRIRVFGARSYDMIRNITLKGRIISTVPINDFPHDFWQEHVIDLPMDALGAIKLENRLVIKDMTADTYKFTDVQLAVQLVDGTWRNTNIETRMQFKDGGIDGWEYAEGKEFENNSRLVTLKFE